ncbi:MAG: hypothetical protein K9N46_08540 [Candidatus Marinimicrobia bacterium]|nr:hypothetical protein [Candidatus Neomarinimicrobiota bacterium]MCF7828855.1 hypothetical protein [Candidatus Neomarinimicrobiota bacterium]MCF7880772.1 hypothetical protein [Candidatus Neomarinimicrobiota bacterium]
MKFSRWIVGSLLVCLGQGLLAQPSDSTQFGFHQQNSTYRWYNQFQYDGQISQVSYELTNSFISTMTKIHESNRQWKDDQQFDGRFYGPMPKSWNWELRGNLQWYNDEQSGYFNDARTGHAALGARRNSRNLQYSLFSGFKQDIRRQFIDDGPTLSGRLRLNQQNWGGYITTGQVQLDGENLDNRQNRTYATRWNVSKQFSPGVSDNLSMNFSQRKRSYYLNSGAVEVREESQQYVSNQLRYKIADPLAMRLNTEYAKRATNIETPFVESSAVQHKNRENYDLRNSLGLFLDIGPLKNEFFARYELQQNLYTTQVRDTLIAADRLRRQTPPDDNSNFIELEGSSRMGIGYRDSLKFSSSASRLQYNTPDSTNFDDRDEVRTRYGLEYFHLVAPEYRFRAGTEVLLNHYVYLFSRRSAENYRNRVFRLYTGLDKKTKSWYWNTSAEVLANYYDYDFDDLLNQVRSLAFRHMILKQQIRHPIWNNWQGQFRFELQLEDQGRLDWEAFIEELMLERQIGEISYQVALVGNRVITGYAGYQYQRRIDWRIQNEERLTAERIYTQGPVFQIIYRQAGMPVLVWEGTLLNVTQENVQQGTRITYPITHLRLQASWRL